MATIDRAALLFTDTVACCLAGTGAEAAKPVIAASGAGTFRVPGLDGGYDRYASALLAAYCIHCLEWDAVHEPAVVHALSVVSGALIAEAQCGEPIPGRNFLDSLIIGVDIAAALGLATKSGLRFFRPATAGVMGAVAALCRLRCLDHETTADALGLALAQASGTMQAHVEGAPALAFQVGAAARAALSAADFAQAGLKGAHDVFGGPFGYFTLIEDGGDITDITGRFGRIFAIDEVSIKPYPSGRASHAVLSTVLAAQEAGQIGPGDVTEIRARVPPLVQRLVGRPPQRQMGAAYARLCLPFLVATALIDGRVDPRRADSADSGVDQIVHDLANRVIVETDENPDPNALFPQHLTITKSDGRVLDYQVPATLGAPDNPLPRADHEAKIAFAASLAAMPLTGENFGHFRRFMADFANQGDAMAFLSTISSEGVGA